MAGAKEAAPARGSDTRQWRHLEVLFLAALAIGLAFMLRVVDGEHVAFWFWPRMTLPGMCVSRYLGFDCPGCGLTRSFVCLAQGDWRTAWAYHPAGWLVALATLAQMPYRVWCLRTGEALSKQAAWWLSGSLMGILLAVWVLRTMAVL